MLRNLYLKSLRDQRRALAWWTVGLVATAVFLMALYPTVRESAGQLNDYVKKMPKAMQALLGGIGDYASPAGYLKAELFNFMMPVVFLIFAIGAGARAIASEERSGTLDLLLANPISRRRVVLQKFGALGSLIVTLSILLLLGLAIGTAAFGFEIGWSGVVAQTFSLAMLAATFGAFSLAVGSLTGSRGIASGLIGGLAVAAYLVNSLSAVASWLRPYRLLSPFHYYSGHDPIVSGLDPVHVAVLLVSTALSLGLAVLAFDRRDLGT
jgi:ABC-2 type transport system permease protein